MHFPLHACKHSAYCLEILDFHNFCQEHFSMPISYRRVKLGLVPSFIKAFLSSRSLNNFANRLCSKHVENVFQEPKFVFDVSFISNHSLFVQKSLGCLKKFKSSKINYTQLWWSETPKYFNAFITPLTFLSLFNCNVSLSVFCNM